MQSKNIILPALAAAALLTSCSSLGNLSADNFTVTPSPLEAVGGQVPVTINGRFPEKYMKKKAVVTVTPVLRYNGGQTDGQSATFQGENVAGNNQEISYKVGGNYTMKNTFTYQPAMAESELYLTFNACIGNKAVKIPEVKVANGVVATSTLLSDAISGANTATGEDKFQYAISQTKEAQIKYLINQANIRTSELRSVSVQDFVQTLRDIKADERSMQIDGIQVSAYASPEGKTSFNQALAEKREGTSTDLVKKQLKDVKLDAPVDSRYTAEDWDGFQQLVAASNMQDKDVILRVLSMYDDPEQREAQIRNLSSAFTELADEILPELRRARLTLNYNLLGRTDSEIQEQYADDPSKLSVEELLYSATLTDDAAQKRDILTTTTRLYPSDARAYNNLGQIAHAAGDLATARNYYTTALEKDPSSAEANANKALVDIAEGNLTEAEKALGKAGNAKNYREAVGNLALARGVYPQAVTALEGCKTNSAALAQILSKDYTQAAKTLSSISSPDATTSYLKAILAARTGQNAQAITALRDAIDKNAAYKTRAASDLEFANLASDSAFAALVK